jgi:hypothetical protein
MCTDVAYNVLPNLHWYNANFTRELEKEINELWDLYPNSEFLPLGDMNSSVGVLQANVPHIWETS